MSREADRLDWAVPPMTGEYEDLDLALLDRSDPDERRFLLEADHPALAEALREGRTEVVIGGQTVNVELHLALHEIVTVRLWNDEPPETWQTAQRLTALGYERHEVLHMLMSVAGDEVRRALTGDQAQDPETSRAALDALPEAWEAGEGPQPLNRAQRRARRRPHA